MYSIAYNLKVIFQRIHTFDAKLLVTLLLEVVLSVLFPLLVNVFPAFLLWCAAQSSYAQAFTMLGVYALALLLCSYGSSRLSEYNAARLIGLRFTYSLDMMEQVLHMAYSDLENPKIRDEQAQAVMYSVNANEYGFEGIIREGKTALSSLCGLLAYILIIAKDDLLFSVLFALVALLQMCMYRRARTYEQTHKQDWIKEARLFSRLQFLFTKPDPAKDIRLYQLQDWIMGKVTRLSAHCIKWNQKVQKRYFYAQIKEAFVLLLRDGIAYLWLIDQAMKGMAMDTFVLYVSLVASLSTWTKALVKSLNHMQMDHRGINDYRQFMEKYQQKDATLSLSDPIGKIEFDHVSFRYEGGDWIFEDFCLTIHAKEKVALVGINGAGKSTLMKLLCGLYVPQRGRVLIDGVEVTKLSAKQRSDLISIVFQDAAVFALSLAQNVSCDDEYEEKAVWEALKQAGLADAIHALPNGIHTPLTNLIEENGVHLSGGETQKLMLARALYHDGKILILDEPSAALDALAEAALYEQYAAMCTDKTSIFISHRLASTKFCDAILYLEKGKIIERGTHTELLAQQGRYAELYEVQAQYYRKEQTV